MKIIRVTAVLAILLSLCFAGIYLKFFSTINSHIDAYIVQVGIYKQEENANEMVAKLTQLQKPNYKYQKDNNYIIITGVFLTEEEAKNMGNDISANGITCVIKQEKFTSDIDKLMNDLFKEDVVFNDNSDYDVKDGEVITFKKK